MAIEKILIIEDDVAEAINAQTELVRAGFKDFRAVTTLSEGLAVMHEYDAVLSDLFFPAGNTSSEKYAARFLPIYEQFKRTRFRKIAGDSIVLGALQHCAQTFDMTPQQYVDTVMANLDTPKNVMSAARDAVAGMKDSERYEAFLKIEEAIKTGANMPLGIVASERAYELGKPVVIVTSTNHHHDSFEPVRALLKAPYRDDLVDGRKNWKAGIDKLIN